MSSIALSRALVVSVIVHLVVVGLFSQETFEHRRGQALARFDVRLVAATLVRDDQKVAPVSESALVVDGAAKSPDSVESGDVVEKAHFLVPPDLAVLESIPVTLSAVVRLRIHVTALGTLSRLEVVSSDPVPAAILDGVLETIGRTPLESARRADGSAIASQIDLVIRVEPESVAD